MIRPISKFAKDEERRLFWIYPTTVGFAWNEKYYYNRITMITIAQNLYNKAFEIVKTLSTTAPNVASPKQPSINPYKLKYEILKITKETLLYISSNSICVCIDCGTKMFISSPSNADSL